ncbi:WG repeat-containing protein [Leptospira sp. 'Mane']|uniref:WG repeat-containing protein n=1 Tax=Leptospira sp. 'Mane' TaxID=3387407 RepID=UPI00398AFBE3
MKRLLPTMFVFAILLPSLSYAQSLISFEKNDLYGFKNKKGKVVITPQYTLVNDFNEKGVAFVLNKNEWACIDSNNKYLLSPFIFDNGPDYASEGLARFVENKKIGFFDSACKKTIKAEYDFANPFENQFSIVCNGCASVKDGEHSTIQGGKYGVINKKGKVVVSIEFDSIVSIDIRKKTATVTKGNSKQEVKLQ